MPGTGAYPLRTSWNVIDRLHRGSEYGDADTAEKTMWEAWIFGASAPVVESREYRVYKKVQGARRWR